MNIITDTDVDDTVQNHKARGRTGFFRDGERRIDMVLVVRDDGDINTEQIKIDFVTNAVKFGLELELEPGVMSLHKRLVFINIHAPDAIIVEYGSKFNIRRYFKNNHVEFTNPRGPVLRLFNFLFVSHEKEWIKIVRKQYPSPKQYSTLERSMIVQKILMLLPFGNHENYIGFNKLLENRIILDIFPLHDGPYFSAPDQRPDRYNARQILHHHWCGLTNIFRPQPLNLIHEYFGDRVAFFFAFYGFYTFSLIFPAAIGTIAVTPEILNKTTEETRLPHFALDTDHSSMKSNHNHSSHSVHSICPRCRDFNACPPLPFSYYNRSITYNNILDKERLDFLMIYITIWATLFILFWKRREYYWMWMWECNPSVLDLTVRPEYVPDKDKFRAEKQKWYRIFPIKKILVFLVTVVIIGGCLAALAIFIVGTIKAHNNSLISLIPKTGYESSGYYMALSIFFTINLIKVAVVEKIISIVSYKLNDLQNHRTVNDYEKSLLLKIFTTTFATTFLVYFYLAFIKAQFYTYPHDKENLHKHYGIFMWQCNPVGCYDELALAIIVALVVREFGLNTVLHLFDMLFSKTDYNQGKSLITNVPCWEREYRLKSVKDDFVTDKFRNLALQFALAIVFINGFPLSPLVVIFINLFDMRCVARQLVLYYRRPLLQKNQGLGGWTGVFSILVFATLVVNTMIVTITSDKFREYITYKINTRRRVRYWEFSIDYYDESTRKEIDDLINKTGNELLKTFKTCDFPASSLYRDYAGKPGTFKKLPDLALSRALVAISTYQYPFMTTLTIIIVLYYVISPRPRDVELTAALEKEIIKKNRPSASLTRATRVP